MQKEKGVQDLMPRGDVARQANEDLRELAGGAWTEVGVENAAAHSGSEPHDVFFGDGAGRFADLGGLSGFRHRGDGRVLVTWDPNQDGALDLAAVHANAPRLVLWENRLGSAAGGTIALRLVGGASPEASDGWSNRDAIGARVEARVGDGTLLRVVSAGEGMASQSSRWVVLGLGDAPTARVDVQWPSGRRTALGELTVGSRWTVDERSGVAVPDVARPLGSPGMKVASLGAAPPKLPAGPALVTTFATWCEACQAEIPALERLGRATGIPVFGAPVDPDESDAAIGGWIGTHRPSWTPLPLAPDQRTAVRAAAAGALGIDAVPTVLYLDADRRIRGAWAGPPTVSALRSAIQVD